ncbi:MAG: sigma-70 family RNA polymerase sigma factor [Longimicrobiales bacterium]
MMTDTALPRARSRPPVSPEPSVTQLLVRIKDGDEFALDRLLPLVYDELRALARTHLSRERVGHTLGATALVHEAYLRLNRQEAIHPETRSHFFAIAGHTMRRILVDYARARKRLKRGAGAEHVSLDEAQAAISDEEADEVLALNDALERLAEINERGSRIVEMRYFAGLSAEETADALGLSVRSVHRGWVSARAWLRKEMGPDVEG